MKVKLRCFPILLIFLIGYFAYYNKTVEPIRYIPDYTTTEDENYNNSDNNSDTYYYNWYDNNHSEHDDYDYDDYSNSNSNRYDYGTTKGIFNKNATESDITKSSNKVNIYMFWGNGCPHCEEQFEFLESIQEEYGDYFNLYAFEVWYDSDNKELMQEFAAAMNETVTGVPYTIIGDKSFTGFSSSYKSSYIEAIKDQHYSNNDVYYDQIR